MSKECKRKFKIMSNWYNTFYERSKEYLDKELKDSPLVKELQDMSEKLNFTIDEDDALFKLLDQHEELVIKILSICPFIEVVNTRLDDEQK